MATKALLLVNVGTPDSASVANVRKYLKEFLGDKRVIAIPWLFRKLLVNGIIAPFRAPKSAKLYQRLWTEQGSPLLVYSQSLASKVQQKLGEHYKVYAAMRYGYPSLKKVLTEIKKQGHSQLIVLPLYPQYATSTTESAMDILSNELKNNAEDISFRIIKQFYNHPAFIEVFTENIKEELSKSDFDHILFSYHGLPVSQVQHIHPNEKYEACNCEKVMPAHGEFCYKATCYQTTRLLVERLQLSPTQYSVAFQSRLTKNWLKPFADETINQLAMQGVKRLLVVAPSFVADCLETYIEIGEEYRKTFLSLGGKKITLVHSLNDSDNWAQVVCEMIKNAAVE